jgi:hypothetical protein
MKIDAEHYSDVDKDLPVGPFYQGGTLWWSTDGWDRLGALLTCRGLEQMELSPMKIQRSIR